MYDTKTVSSDMGSLSLYVQQTKDVAEMRASLLCFDRNDPNSARKALQNITVLRVYHQISRIIRYTELMDKLEDKLYQSLDTMIDNMDPEDFSTWHTLISVQNKLQENMIQSHKLLEPYLNMEALTFVEVKAEGAEGTDSTMILSQDSREKLRNSAQEVLKALEHSTLEEEEIKNERDGEEQHQSGPCGLDIREPLRREQIPPCL